MFLKVSRGIIIRWNEVFMKKKYIVLILAVLGIDLFTKSLAQTHLANTAALTIIPNFFELTYVVNTGAAWSILEGQRTFFIVLSSIVALGLVYFLTKEKENLLLSALSLMLAGTLGNLYDRIAFGFVRDMLSFNLFGYRYPVFNIADSALVIGVFLIILDMFIKERRVSNHA